MRGNAVTSALPPKLVPAAVSFGQRSEPPQKHKLLRAALPSLHLLPSPPLSLPDRLKGISDHSLFLARSLSHSLSLGHTLVQEEGHLVGMRK